ncbi:MAG: peptidoglycan-binding protein [Actinomycetota bacterium]|nr:peptidoglycan-binding protein [Actinomycetota bacterium]
MRSSYVSPFPALALALATALVVVLACASAAQALPTLHHGDRGRSVAKLQRALHLHADGLFGRGTVRAVKRFQRRHRMHADGVVGAGTWRMIRRSLHRNGSSRSGGRPVVRHRGSSVRMLQRRLGISADGVYGSGSARAVKRFQRRHGLHADGIVGPATWAALGLRGRHPVLKPLHMRRARRGGVPAVVWHAISAANRIAGFPYKYGGGHGSFHDSGYDCSGSVSYVLRATGRLGRPRDSGELMSWGSPGPGRYITVYANPGHAYMVIRGRRYDTSGKSRSASRWQARGRSTAGYTVRHPPGL